jgi:hypothetical protein
MNMVVIILKIIKKNLENMLEIDIRKVLNYPQLNG